MTELGNPSMTDRPFGCPPDELPPADIRLVLPLPPGVNNLYGNKVKGGGRFNSKRYTAWIKTADAHYMQRKRSLKPITGYFRFRVLVPMAMRGDVDGRIKAPLDRLVSWGLVPDDRYCIVSSAERDDKILRTECVVEVRKAYA